LEFCISIQTYTQLAQAENWLQRYQDKKPGFVCVLGFTETGLLPGISAAGATPDDRRYTAIADAEFLVNGPQPQPCYPLPPLHQGASPVLISRAVIESLNLPCLVFNAGLPQPPAVPAIDLGGQLAACLTTGSALPRTTVEHLLTQGLAWGEELAQNHPYSVLAECVVGGTTTALAILTGLGYPARDKVNSSHPTCNHVQKWQVVQQGLAGSGQPNWASDPLGLVAAVGDPMQIVVAGMTLAASRTSGVLLAGGTQMLAVHALAQTIAKTQGLTWNPEQVVVGTTRWVAEDPTGDTVGLAQLVEAPMLATTLSFAQSRYPQLQAYEQGYVKEGVGAGGAAIAAHLAQRWGQHELLTAIETLASRLEAVNLDVANSATFGGYISQR
jgi:uncharacterized protein (TIGR00303 family)